MQSLKLKSGAEWRAYTKSGKKPIHIPANPNVTYAEVGWAGMGDWLGTGTIAPRLRVYRPFEGARAFVQSLGLKSTAEWIAYTKSGRKPTDIPAYPSDPYAKDGWAGLGDWLGTGAVADHLRKYRSFYKARAFVRRLRLRSAAEWFKYCKSGKKPADIPASPANTYAKDGWSGMADWLGYVRSGHSLRSAVMRGTGEAPAPADAPP